ncbi:hypothetical protein PINS_up006233 [Pythium insidiosum]|nr:hypothetical protein PINS_up006233 [Pythium insidiosum]
MRVLVPSVALTVWAFTFAESIDRALAAADDLVLTPSPDDITTSNAINEPSVTTTVTSDGGEDPLETPKPCNLRKRHFREHVDGDEDDEDDDGEDEDINEDGEDEDIDEDGEDEDVNDDEDDDNSESCAGDSNDDEVSHSASEIPPSSYRADAE